MKIWIAICLTWFAARMSLAAPALSNEGASVSLFSAGKEKIEKMLLSSGFRSRLALKTLTADNFSKIDLALKELNLNAKSKTASAISSDMASLIRSFSSFDSFLLGTIPVGALPIEMPNIKLTGVETQVYKVMARTIVYPEVVYYLSLVKLMNNSLSSSTSLISSREQEVAQAKCFAENKLTLSCLHENALKAKVSFFLNSIGMTVDQDFEHAEIIEAILELIQKKSHTKNIVAKELFFYEGAEYILKNNSQLDLFTICIGNDKDFRYWQMESMTYCRSIWQKELGSVEMDPELESIFFRQVTQFDAPVMKLVQGLSREILAPKTGCSKSDRNCLEKVFKKRLGQWTPAQSFSQKQLENFSKSLALNFII